MRTSKHPGRGEIWSVSLDPAIGKEQRGMRPVLVMSTADFSWITGTAMICPITQGGTLPRAEGFAVTLSGAGTATQGIVMAHQGRTIDIKTRGGRYLESVPDFVAAEVLAKMIAILE